MVKTADRKPIVAVSPVIATLLLILIAIAAGVVVYAYVLGYVGSATRGGTTGSGTLSIEAVDLKRFATSANMTIYLRNIGGIPISLVSATVFLVYPDGSEISATLVTAFLPSTLNPGSATTTAGIYRVNYPPSPTVNSGQTYTVKVIADDGTSSVDSVKAHA